MAWRLCEDSPDLVAEGGDDLLFEPGIPFEPEDVPGAGMRQGEELRQIFGMGADGLAEGILSAPGQVAGLGVTADEQGQLDFREKAAQARMPQRGALGARREIATFPFARIAESGGDNGYAVFVVEDLPRQPEPGAQTVPGRVVPRNAGFVDAPSRGLADDQQPCGGGGAKHRAGRAGENARADRACADFAQQTAKLGIRAGHGRRMVSGGRDESSK